MSLSVSCPLALRKASCTQMAGCAVKESALTHKAPTAHILATSHWEGRLSGGCVRQAGKRRGALIDLDSKGAALQVSAMEVCDCLLSILFCREAYCAIALRNLRLQSALCIQVDI